MYETMLASISLPSAIWLFLAAFMLHDFEEIIRIEPWMRRHYPYLQSIVPKGLHKELERFARITAPQFAVAVCLEFVIFIPVTYVAAERSVYLPFVGFNVMMLLHVFMHVGQALYTRMLVPGVTTAVLITLPYSVFMLSKLLAEELVTITDMLIGIPFGLLLGPIVLAGHQLGKRLVPSE